MSETKQSLRLRALVARMHALPPAVGFTDPGRLIQAGFLGRLCALTSGYPCRCTSKTVVDAFEDEVVHAEKEASRLAGVTPKKENVA